MIGSLPRTLMCGGIERKINSDFRNILTINAAFCDDLLYPREQLHICMKRLYTDIGAIDRADFEEAQKKAFWFIRGGDVPEGKPAPCRLIDWKHDESMIFAAVNNVAHCEVRALEYMHWWTFLGYLSERSEKSLLSSVIALRYKLGTGKKLDKWDKEFLKNNRELVILRTEKEKREIAEVEEFLRRFT